MATLPETRAPHPGHHPVGRAPSHPDIRWTTNLIPAPGRMVPVRVFVPTNPTGMLVWAHGGSWVRGSSEAWHVPCADLSAVSGSVVVSVDYRLAPLHHHPAPVDDLLTVLEWSRQEMTGRGSNHQALAVGGDSAGGTLAACAALTWRDRGHTLAAQVLAYPPMDPRCDAASYRSDPDQFPDRSTLRRARASYLGPATTTVPSNEYPYRSPMDATTLVGAPPAVLAVGDQDPVRDDVAAYAARLTSAGVPVQHRTFADTPHGAFLHDPPIATTGPEPTMRAWIAARLRLLLAAHPPARTLA